MMIARPSLLLAFLIAFAPMLATVRAQDVTPTANQEEKVPSAPEIDTRLPIQALNTDLSMALSRAPGVFSYAFDAAGWPNGLSAWGADPNHTQLYWDGRPVEDLLTGRPRFDMVPVALLSKAGWRSDGSTYLRTDSIRTPSPITRVRYESAGDGLQAVSALHVQNRFFRMSDSTGVRLQTIFGYAGAGAAGEYDGSQLTRARQITARIGLTGDGWAVWIQDVASRRAVGAHAGVVPFTGAAYESIYQRLGATVSDPTARRRTIHNDAELGGSTTWRKWSGTLRVVRTSQTLDFRGSSLSTRGWTTRWHLLPSVEQEFGPGTLRIQAHFLRDAGFGGSAWTTSPSSRIQTGITTSLERLDSWKLEAGLRNGSNHSWWHAAASGSVRTGVLLTHGLVQRTARRVSLFELVGFGTGIDGLATLSDIPLQESILARLGVQVRRGVWQVDLEASYLQEKDAIIHQIGASHPDLESSTLSGTRSRSVTDVSLGWRDDGRRGLYTRVSAALSVSNGPDDSQQSVLWEQSLPRQWAAARIGWRALLFQSDLDLDVYIRARAWDAMTGLRLHTPTGLLVLPEEAGESVDQNWLVDVVAEGDVRGATLFFAYENMFSGTTWQIGNLIVPDYPLPRQRIRFGVYWPIAN